MPGKPVLTVCVTVGTGVTEGVGDVVDGDAVG
jgi:hypothetical protein